MFNHKNIFFSGVMVYEDVHSGESERTEEEEIFVSKVEIREDKMGDVSSDDEDEECKIRQVDETIEEG